MNLGTIKDKSGKSILRKKTVKNALVLASLSCVAVIAVTASVALSGKDEQSPVLEAPKNTEAQISNGSAQILTATPLPTATPDLETNADESASVSSGATVSAKMLMPITEGSILKGYAADSLVYSATLDHWATHTALDISAPEGTIVLSVLDGTVSEIVDDELMGLSVKVTHENGLETIYSALESASVAEGDAILQGQAIGAVGNSASSESSDGAHLHFEVLKDGKSVNPQNYISGFGK